MGVLVCWIEDGLVDNEEVGVGGWKSRSGAVVALFVELWRHRQWHESVGLSCGSAEGV